MPKHKTERLFTKFAFCEACSGLLRVKDQVTDVAALQRKTPNVGVRETVPKFLGVENSASRTGLAGLPSSGAPEAGAPVKPSVRKAAATDGDHVVGNTLNCDRLDLGQVFRIHNTQGRLERIGQNQPVICHRQTRTRVAPMAVH